MKEQKEIVDIIVFGSYAREKENPQDIDLAIISDKDISAAKLEQDVKNKIKLPAHASTIKPKDIFRETIWKSVIHEGISIAKGKNISVLLGYQPYVLFSYNMSKLKQLQKTKLSYALFGRNGKEGLFKRVKSIPLGRGAFLVPVNKEDEVRDLFFQWELPFERRRILAEI